MTTERIDVLAVIARAINTERMWGDYTTANDLTLVSAAVAELIAADKELDAAYAEFPGLGAERHAIERAAMRVNVAMLRRSAALARIGDAQ